MVRCFVGFIYIFTSCLSIHICLCPHVPSLTLSITLSFTGLLLLSQPLFLFSPPHFFDPFIHLCSVHFFRYSFFSLIASSVRFSTVSVSTYLTLGSHIHDLTPHHRNRSPTLNREIDLHPLQPDHLRDKVELVSQSVSQSVHRSLSLSSLSLLF